MATPQEVELKLFLPEGADERLKHVPLLRGVASRRIRLDAVYFDTSDRLLQKHGMALRLRRTGRQWIQTLKATHSARGGLSSRPEWESPARLVQGKPRIDLARLADSPLPALLARQRAPSRLRPLFRIRVQRTVQEIAFRRSHIEVAMDRGRIEAERAGQRVSAPVDEIELELKDGRAEDLVRAALRLIGAAKTGNALVPMLRGKAERGYRLASASPPPPTKAAARGFVATLRPEMTLGTALRAIVAHGLDVVLANTEALRDVHAPEYVHQARVALRRMRSAVRLLDRGHRDFPEALASELQWVGRLLGSARDWDVLVGETLPSLLRAAPEQLGDAAKATLDRARAQCDIARGDLLAALATARYARLCLQLQIWTMTSPPKGRTLRRLAPRALGKLCRRLFNAALFFAALSPERRHRVRILAKRLRYSLDVLAVTLPGHLTEHYIAALSELQDVLGELNDGQVAAGVLDQLGASKEITSFARAWLAGRTDERAKLAERHLLALHERTVPWE